MPRATELIEDLNRRLRVADALLAALADDMTAAGASSASERAQRVRAELHGAREVVQQVAEELPRDQDDAR
ncbi:MAG: hypothetical protein JJD92_06105 [Frankiaceae bacterium]|nr:hypothetical protein [Frankiaceae bacterium]